MVVPIAALGLTLTVLMLIDSVSNRRDLVWIFVLVLLLPVFGVGALVYMAYNYRSITFPFRLARALDGLPHGHIRKRCPRCFRDVDSLAEYQDGRSVRYLCTMCRAEMDITHAETLKLP